MCERAGISPLQQMLASGTGALLTSLLVTPLDVVKIRLQAQQTPFHQALTSQSPAWSSVLRPSRCEYGAACGSLVRLQVHHDPSHAPSVAP